MPKFAVLIDVDLCEKVCIMRGPDDMGRVLVLREDGKEYHILADNLVAEEWEGVARALLAQAAKVQKRINELPGAFDA